MILLWTIVILVIVTGMQKSAVDADKVIFIMKTTTTKPKVANDSSASTVGTNTTNAHSVTSTFGTNTTNTQNVTNSIEISTKKSQSLQEEDGKIQVGVGSAVGIACLLALTLLILFILKKRNILHVPSLSVCQSVNRDSCTPEEIPMNTLNQLPV